MNPTFRQIKFLKPAKKTAQHPISRSDRSSTWNLLQKLLPEEVEQQPPPTESEARILRAFGRHPDSLLELPDIKSLPSPFEYHLTCNDDASYITQPRLSVTKLLTGAWCELREYYSVFAGLPRTPPLARMMSGSKYHAKLENAEHHQIDMALLDALIEKHLAVLSPDVQQELVATSTEYGMASSWIEHNIKRLLHLATTKLAREVYLHGFLDLDTAQFASHADAFADCVLVNGVADIVKIKPVSGEAEQSEPSSKVMDLNAEIALSSEKIHLLAKDHTLVMGDVKTRGWNSIPAQKLVVKAAKTQCMYYAQMFQNLTHSDDFAYKSYMENGKRRGIDADVPISIAFVAKLLVEHFRTIAIDCLRLARGEPIGIEDLDRKRVSCPGYSLRALFAEEDFRELLSEFYGEDPEIMQMDLSPLFQAWHQPFTFRYVAARGGQVSAIFKNFHPSVIEVEYHNVKTETIFERKVAPHDPKSLQDSVSGASLFWAGKRLPSVTDDLSRCNFCDYKNRCPAINENSDSSILQKIYELQGTRA